MKSIFLIIIFVFSCLSSCNSMSYESLLFKGENAVNQNRFKEAVYYFSEAIAITPNDPQAYVFRGYCYNELLEYELAVADLHRASDLNGDKYAVDLNIGNSYFGLNKYQEALFYFKSALDINPKDYKANYNVGFCFFNLNDNKNSVKFLTAAILIDPNSSEAFGLRRLVYAEMNDYERALDDESVAIKLDPNNDNLYSTKGILLIHVEKYEEALYYFNSAINLNSENLEAYYYRANCYMQTDEINKGCEDLIFLNSKEYIEHDISKTLNKYCK